MMSRISLLWKWYFVVTLSGFFFPLPSARSVELTSPNGELKVTLEVRGGPGGGPVYSATFHGRPLLLESGLGVVLEGDDPALGLVQAAVALESVRREHHPQLGERSTVWEHFEGARVELVSGRTGQPALGIELRVFDHGLAFRYSLPAPAAPARLMAEQTEFRLPEGAFGYEEHGTEGEYRRTEVPRIQQRCERPLTLELPWGGFAAICEAELVDYSRMLLSPKEGTPGTLVADLEGPVGFASARTTPWRVVLVADSPGALLEANDIVRVLNPPPAGDFSWVRPGKAIREVTLSTEGGIACVDFAAEMGLQYIEFDAGWYGHEYDNTQDATTVTVDPKRNPAPDPLDLPGVIQYARARDIGVLLYVNQRHLERQLDDLLPLYRDWGVAGLKYGFVRSDSQDAMQFLRRAVRLTGEHRMVIDIHDSFRPTGWSWTYPHLLTQEGIRGNEHMPTAEHNVTLPFTRCLAGASDYTFCYYSNRIQTTHAHQLAAPVVFYSPLQFLFWYDRPSAYQGEPELEFWKALPTVWDDTRVLLGRIGDYVSVARRRGQEWFVGTLTDEHARQLELPLDFLDPARPYRVREYRDAPPGAGGRTGVAREEFTGRGWTTWTARLAESGGHALWIRPAEPQGAP